MRKPDIPADEEARLRDLHHYEILDTPSERVFDEIAQLAATICGTPYAAITLIDRERQWFKAVHGLEIKETSRDESVCGHAILEREFFEVPDLQQDERFVDNPQLNGAVKFRFYGGSQLTNTSGSSVGMLCVLDEQPRQLTHVQRNALSQLADVVMALLEGNRQRRRKEWFGALVDEVSDEIFIIDAQSYRYLHANAGALKHLGYPLDQLREMTPVDITPTLSHAEFLTYMQELRKGARHQVVYEGTRRPSNGEAYPVEIRWQQLFTSDRPVIISLVHDISERKAIERMKDEFIAVVNHELRTPLTSIHGAIKLLERGSGGTLPEPAARLVSLASTNTGRLLRIVDDILDLEKIASGRMEFDIRPVEAGPLLMQVAQSHEAVAGSAGVRLVVESPDGLWLRADMQRLQQVLGNLVSNALKFAPRDSTVELQAQRHGRRMGDRVRLCVTDHGPGIPEHFRDKIFQRFAQADMNTTRQKGGSGLGLSIVKQMTEQMNGSVGYESRPGCTTFHVELPGGAA